MSSQEPLAIKLGTRVEYVNTGPKRRLSEIDDTFQYVSLLQGLKSLLSHADIRDEVSDFISVCISVIVLQVLRQHCSTDGVVADYCDGDLYKTHDLFSLDNTALQLILYFDEIVPLVVKTVFTSQVCMHASLSDLC